MTLWRTASVTLLWVAVVAISCSFISAVPTDGPKRTEDLEKIKEICRSIRTADEIVYNALDMRHKPSRDKELLRKSLEGYNDALLSLRKMAVDHKDEVLREAKDIFDEGLPKYFQVSFAEYKLKDNLDMTSDEVEKIYVYRGQAMETWSDLHFELGIPW